MKPTRACSVDGCDRPHQAGGYCNTHYLRWYSHGDANVDVRPRSDAERFWSRVTGGSVEECWVWTGARTPTGYGRFYVDGRDFPAHRWSYEHMRAPIPAGLEIDHLCHTRSCVNPWHLEPVTSAVNKARSRAALSDSCKRGHKFTPENTYIRPNRSTRECLTCRALYRQHKRPVGIPGAAR